jgi:hypothetical protein
VEGGREGGAKQGDIYKKKGEEKNNEKGERE